MALAFYFLLVLDTLSVIDAAVQDLACHAQPDGSCDPTEEAAWFLQRKASRNSDDSSTEVNPHTKALVHDALERKQHFIRELRLKVADKRRQARQGGSQAPTCMSDQGACIFPFIYKESIMERCSYNDVSVHTHPHGWCATKTNEHGEHAGVLARCNPSCEHDDAPSDLRDVQAFFDNAEQQPRHQQSRLNGREQSHLKEAVIQAPSDDKRADDKEEKKSDEAKKEEKSADDRKGEKADDAAKKEDTSVDAKKEEKKSDDDKKEEKSVDDKKEEKADDAKKVKTSIDDKKEEKADEKEENKSKDVKKEEKSVDDNKEEKAVDAAKKEEKSVDDKKEEKAEEKQEKKSDEAKKEEKSADDKKEEKVDDAAKKEEKSADEKKEEKADEKKEEKADEAKTKEKSIDEKKVEKADDKKQEPADAGEQEEKSDDDKKEEKGDEEKKEEKADDDKKEEKSGEDKKEEKADDEQTEEKASDDKKEEKDDDDKEEKDDSSSATELVRDTAADGKKCGEDEAVERVFDLRREDSTEDNCKKKCSESADCVAVSGLWGDWCLGCNVPLNLESGLSGVVSYKKLKAGDEQKDEKVEEEKKAENAVDEKKQEKAVDEKTEEKAVDEKTEEKAVDEKKEENAEDSKKEETASDEKKEEKPVDEKTEEKAVDEKKEEKAEDSKKEETASDEKKEEKASEDNKEEAAIGFKNKDGSQHVIKDGIEVVIDKKNNGKKCATDGAKERLFDLRGEEASNYTCKLKCLETSSCVAVSGVPDFWCIGCSVPLAEEGTPGVIAYRKQKAFGSRTQDGQGKWEVGGKGSIDDAIAKVDSGEIKATKEGFEESGSDDKKEEKASDENQEEKASEYKKDGYLYRNQKGEKIEGIASADKKEENKESGGFGGEPVIPQRSMYTLLTSDGTVGSTKLEVAGNKEFQVGDAIAIRSSAGTEVNKIKGFGSILLFYPLLYKHPQSNCMIVKLEENDPLMAYMPECVAGCDRTPKGLPASSMVLVRDNATDNLKCGGADAKERLFDERENATEENCKKLCLEDNTCVAVSGEWGAWCVGCKVPLFADAAQDGVFAYIKRDKDASGKSTKSEGPRESLKLAPGKASSGKASWEVSGKLVFTDPENSTWTPGRVVEPFGQEKAADQLQGHAARTQDILVDAMENAEVAEVKRTVYRTLTRLRSAQVKDYDTIARRQIEAVDSYNDVHDYRSEYPLTYLDDAEKSIYEDKFTSFHE